jgi:non-ribosomal peptide synthase protein (TIGR01720 family)
VLGLVRVGIHENFFHLGGDSIMAIQVVAAAREAGLILAARDLFEHQTIARVAQAAAGGPRSAAQQGPVTGEVPLTPIQHWFFEQSPVGAHHFNQALFLEVTEPLDADQLHEALGHLMAHHDGLRSRFRRTNGAWRQELLPPGGETPLEIVDLSDLPTHERAPFVEMAAERAQASLHLSDGPLLRVVLFRSGPTSKDRLLFVIHHLVVDAVSWPILLADLERALRQLRNGEPPSLGPKTSSVQEWARHLAIRAASPEVAERSTYWLGSRWEAAHPIPRDHHRGANVVGFTHSVRVSLDRTTTRALLRELPRAHDTSPDELLMTALARVFARWTGQRQLLLDIEGHGRDESAGDVDLSRTVGWFTAIFPVLLEVVPEWEHRGALHSVREQLRAVPDRGLAFGVARYLARDGALARAARTRPRPEVLFNYLGRFDSRLGHGTLFRRTDWPLGSARAASMTRAHLIEINAVVMDERLQAHWTYSRNFHRNETIRRVANGFIAELNVLIEHFCHAGSESSEHSEFGWTRDEVNDLLIEVDDRRKHGKP